MAEVSSEIQRDKAVFYNDNDEKIALHETYKLREGLYVTRVPGGWIYTVTIIQTSSSVFVPYSADGKPE